MSGIDQERLANRRRKQVYMAVGSAAFFIAASALQLVFMRFEGAGPFTRVMLVTLLNVNLLALFWLAFFVIRSLHRLQLERRRGMAGHKFKTKVVAIFLIMISIPLALLFVIAGTLGTNYIDRFFAPSFRAPLKSATEVASRFYELERERALQFAYMARDGYTPPSQYAVTTIANITGMEGPSAAVEAAFAGRYETEVISDEHGDIIRAAVPMTDRPDADGIVMVETAVPEELMVDLDIITQSYKKYVELETQVSPAKINYLLILAFFTLLIVFASIWIALRIAGWMTEPVRDLALATQEIAAGDLNVQVQSKVREDEMGMLVDSFNRMVKEIRIGRESIEQAYLNLDSIVRNIQAGVISLDAAGNVRSMNEAACRIFGLESGGFIGKPYGALLEHIDSEGLRAMVRSIRLNTFREATKEIVASVRDRKALLKVTITGLRSTDAAHRGILVVIDDLTDVVRAQRALAWQEVARRMAHEIKNPLTPIRLSTERMRRKWDSKSEDFPDIFERSTSTIIREVDALKALVDSFSKFGKMPEIKKSSVELYPVLDEITSLYRDYKELEIKIGPAAGRLVAEIDREQFKRVLINLFDNAIEAMGKKGVVTVTLDTAAEPGFIHISVADTGPGIRPEDKERLFQPYFSTKKTGTGLGLAIASRIIDEHGGSIGITDNSPVGSVFTIRIPYAVAAGEADQTKAGG